MSYPRVRTAETSWHVDWICLKRIITTIEMCLRVQACDAAWRQEYLFVRFRDSRATISGQHRLWCEARPLIICITFIGLVECLEQIGNSSNSIGGRCCLCVWCECATNDDGGKARSQKFAFRPIRSRQLSAQGRYLLPSDAYKSCGFHSFF